MALQAPADPSLEFAYLRNRPPELLEEAFANAGQFTRHDNFNTCLLKLPANLHQQISQQVAPTMMFGNSQQQRAANACAHVAVEKKKRKDLNKAHAEKRPRIQNAPQMTSCAASLDIINEARRLPALGLSLGQVSAIDLRAHAKDDGSIVTSSRVNLVLPTNFSDRLSAQLSKQQDEIFDLLKIQMEQLRLIIQERTKLHSKTFLATVGEGFSLTLRARDMELERISQKNMELEQKVNHLSLETQAWQSKAWSYDAMVNALRENLQQVLMHQSRCQGKVEGFGDSDNDASSACVGKTAQQTRAMLAMTNKSALQRACKKCKSREVSILVLPCLHLCLCSACRENIERCPICNFQICDRVEVYLS